MSVMSRLLLDVIENGVDMNTMSFASFETLKEKLTECKKEWEEAETDGKASFEAFMKVNHKFSTEDYIFIMNEDGDLEVTVKGKYIIDADDICNISQFIEKFKLPELRFCEHCGKPMQAGYVLENGMDYACTECFPFMMDEEYGVNRWSGITYNSVAFSKLGNPDNLGMHQILDKNGELVEVVDWSYTSWKQEIKTKRRANLLFFFVYLNKNMYIKRKGG